MPHPQQGMPNPQYMAAAAHQRNMPQVNEAVLRRSRKPTDKTIPEGVEDIIIGEGVEQYKSLREIEKRLDSSMVRKRLDIQDSISRTVKRYRTLRIWVSNTVEDQPWQKVGEQNGANPVNPGSGRYRVKIEGRLLDDDDSDSQLADDDSEEDDHDKDGDAMEEDTTEDAKPKKSNSKRSHPRLSQFLKSITIDFDKTPSVKPEDIAPITWTKPQLPPNTSTLPPTADFDSLQFSRGAQENVNITLSLVRDESPERYKLSKELADVLDVEEESRSGIVLGIWDYIRAMGLQEDEDKRSVRCDQRLRTVCFRPFDNFKGDFSTHFHGQIFGRDQMFFPQIPEAISVHTTPLDPIKLPYTIRVDQEFHDDPKPTIYDIRVAVDDPLRQKMIALTSNPQHAASIRQIGILDDQLALIIQALMHSKARHSFYTALSKDPATFIRRWLNSQRRDLEAILGEATRGGGEDASGPEFRRGGSDGVWNAPVAREAVRYMLAKPEAAGGVR